MHRRSLAALLFAIFLLSLPAGARANGGARDTTFGGTGFVTSSGAAAASAATDVAFQADGKIVVAGIAGPTLLSLAGADSSVLVVARFTASGGLDGSFGSGGLVTTPIGDRVRPTADVLIQPDGMIVVATTTVAAGGDRLTLARYDQGGVLDPAFGSGGIVTTPYASVTPTALLRQSDGKLVVVGNAGNQFLATRYDDDGALDTSYGSAGVTLTPVGVGNCFAADAVLQPDGRVVAAGYATNGSGDRDFALVRWDGDGALDATFGSGGIEQTAIGSFDDSANSVVYQPDGTLVIAGHHGSSSALARYDSAGVLDATFGSAGVANVGSAVVGELVRQSDGKLVAAGTISFVYGPDSAYSVGMSRFTADGALDPSFGSGGSVVDEYDSITLGGDVGLQADGRIVLVGFTGHRTSPSSPPTNLRMAVARYLPNCGDGLLDPGEQCEGECCLSNCLLADAGTACDDGDACSSGDVCDGAGSCTAEAAPGCGPCETCDSGLGCVAAPRPSCTLPVQPGASSLLLKNSTAGDKLTWKWAKGAATTLADFGAPLTTDGLTLCIFDATPNVVVSAIAPAGGTCGTKPCWKTTSTGYAYGDKLGTPNGIVSTKLKAGVDGKAKIGVGARGVNLAVPTLQGLALPLRVQLWSAAGSCWEADYSASGMKRNDSTVFQGRSD